jgi:RHS repeat-associated protein
VGHPSNRLVRKVYPDYSQANYTYDAAGRLTQVTDPSGTYAFYYDNMSRLTSAATNYSFLNIGYKGVSYGYDAASNRTSMTDPQGTQTSYGYDTLNRLVSLAYNGQNPGFGFGYDALNRRTSLTRPNGVSTTYSYDPLSRLLSVLHQASGTTLDGASYTYDNAGNRLSKTDLRTSVASNYSYDPIYQLLQVTQGGSTTESYSYDPVGNRLSSLGVSPYNYNSSNQLTSTPSATYAYDANGNTLTKSDSSGTTQYGWDFDNRLTSVTVPNVGTTSFRYDPFGRRVQKSGPSGTTNFWYDGHNVLEEVDSAGNVLARYTQPEYLDEPLGQLRSGTTSYYQQDALRSVTSLSNGAGAVAKTYSFDSFGNTTASTGTLVNPFQYTGREFDSETGLFFNRARYFDPLRGRFISEDPARFFGGFNFYTYVDNDPVDWTDPTGLKTYECTAPLHAAPKLYHKLPLMYHAYLCVVGQDGKPVCVGQDRSGSAVWSPGKPSDDTMEGGQCKQKDPDDQCIEQCILAEGAKPRPQYGIGPQGTDCQEWADDTLSKCEKQCGKKKGWSIF